MPQGVLLGVSLAATAASAAMSYVGARQQAKAAEQAAEYNAKVQEQEAVREEMESREERIRLRIQGKKTAAKQRVKMAQSGIVAESGSSLLAMAEEAMNQELAVNDAARASNIRAGHLREGAKMERFEGKSIAAGKRAEGRANLLSGASRMANQYYNR